MYPKLSPEEYERLTLLQRPEETASAVMVRALNLLWEQTAKREGMR